MWAMLRVSLSSVLGAAVGHVAGGGSEAQAQSGDSSAT